MPTPNAYDACRGAIFGYFQTIFVDQTGATVDDGNGNQIPKDFLPFSTPNRRVDVPDPAAPYARATVNDGRPFGKEVGSGSKRSVGYFTVEVFMPENTGTQISRDAANVVRNAFEYRRLAIPTGILRFFEVGCRDVSTPEGGWAKANVEVLFWADTLALGKTDPDFSDPNSAASLAGYILLATTSVQTAPNALLGVAMTSNVARDSVGNIVLRNTTTAAYRYLAMQGQPGAEVIVPLDTYAGAQKNLSTDANGNLRLYNETTADYRYPSIQNGAVVASPTWTLPGSNWAVDPAGNLQFRVVGTATFQQVSFQGAAGQEYLAPVNA